MTTTSNVYANMPDKIAMNTVALYEWSIRNHAEDVRAWDEAALCVSPDRWARVVRRWEAKFR